jgi:hypothetical protein
MSRAGRGGGAGGGVGSSITADITGQVNAKPLVLPTGGELTISGGFVIVPSSGAYSRYRIDTEADAATDDLVQLIGGSAYQVLVLSAQEDTRTVVLKHGVVNLFLDGGRDFALATSRDKIVLMNEGGSEWHELARSSLAHDDYVYKVAVGVDGAYQTIQAALDAGAAGSAAAFVVEYAPGTYAENLTVGAGKGVTLRSSSGEIYSNTISGNITWNPTGPGSSLVIENTYVTGTVGGAATVGAAYLLLNGTGIDGAVTFTGTAVHVYSDGGGGFNSGYQGYLGAAVAVTGSFVAVDTGLFGAVTAAITGIFLHACRLQGTFALTTAATDIRLSACDRSSGAQTLVFSGSAGTVTADQYSMTQIIAGGTTKPTNGVWSNGAGDVTDQGGTSNFTVHRTATRFKRGSTANATPVALDTFTLPASCEATVTARINARDRTADDHAGYVVHAAFKRRAAGTSIVGAAAGALTAESDATWAATLDASGNDIRVMVTGAATNVCDWAVHWELHLSGI